MTTTVEALLADPAFDVEHFLHNVNLHEARPELMGTLVADPAIALSIAEGPEWKILERFPPTPDEFIKLKDLGLEAWHKQTDEKYNHWYGIIAGEELALFYRRVSEREVTVYRGKNAAVNARKRWKQLKMTKYGEEKTSTALQPGERPVDKIRARIRKMMKDTGFSTWYGRQESTDASFSYHHGPYGSSRKEISFRIEARGPNKVGVELDVDGDGSSWDRKNWLKTKIPLVDDPKAKPKTFRFNQVVAEEIWEWLKENHKTLKRLATKNKV
jgi:hypothetical protein